MIVLAFNAVAMLTFFSLFAWRCIKADSNLTDWIIASIWVSVVPDFVVCIIIFGSAIHLKRLTGRKFVWDLGNPENYLMTISWTMLCAMLVNVCGRLIIGLPKWQLDECSETRLICRVLHESIGMLLPMGFFSVVDIFTPPIVREWSSEMNFGISSASVFT
jgi:hypothetical protein